VGGHCGVPLLLLVLSPMPRREPDLLSIDPHYRFYRLGEIGAAGARRPRLRYLPTLEARVADRDAFCVAWDAVQVGIAATAVVREFNLSSQRSFAELVLRGFAPGIVREGASNHPLGERGAFVYLVSVRDQGRHHQIPAD